MPQLDESLPALREALLGHPGPPPPAGAEPAPGPFEAIVGAALGLVADPRVASAAFGALRDAGWLEAPALAAADPLEIDEVFRAAKVRLPARSLRPLRRVARWAADRGFDVDQAASASTDSLREEWRGLNGVGPATADALLLFGLGRPAYPMDRATYRILVRHGWLDSSADYDEARSVAEGLAPDDPATLGRLSVALARLGRDHCKPAVARCEGCPLRPLLPPGGPRESE